MLNEIVRHVQLTCARNLADYRVEMLDRQVQARMSHQSIETKEAYLALLRSNPIECEHLLDAITNTYTQFFRDPFVFDYLARAVLPDILQAKQRSRSHEYLVWSAGCSSGEEPYSIAMLLASLLERQHSSIDARVVATDIEPKALGMAEAAMYPRSKLSEVRLSFFDQYFSSDVHDRCVVHPDIRRMVRFQKMDLLDLGHSDATSLPPGTFDLILCRNVLIYLSDGAQKRIIQRLAGSLTDGGVLVLGTAERVNVSDCPLLICDDVRCRVYRRRHETVFSDFGS